MKKLYLTLLFFSIITFSFANAVITDLVNGNWKNNSTWSLNRIPADGDTVVIPAGKIVVIDNVQNLSISYTGVRMLKNASSNSNVNLSATSHSLYIHFPAKVKNVSVRLTSINGQAVSKTMLSEAIGQAIVPVQQSVKGIYVVTITDGDALNYSKQVFL